LSYCDYGKKVAPSKTQLRYIPLQLPNTKVCCQIAPESQNNAKLWGLMVHFSKLPVRLDPLSFVD